MHNTRQVKIDTSCPLKQLTCSGVYKQLLRTPITYVVEASVIRSVPLYLILAMTIRIWPNSSDPASPYPKQIE